jgi:uncharacterized protein YdhG (YjbR/CyaY superfamily)
MEKLTSKFETVDAYFASLDTDTKAIATQIRETIKKAAPEAEEVISYQMPAYKYKGMLVYFAAWKSHIGFYPVTTAIKAFDKDLSNYEVSKGTIKFPFSKPIPLDLISRIVKFRIKENEEKEKTKEMAKRKR